MLLSQFQILSRKEHNERISTIQHAKQEARQKLEKLGNTEIDEKTLLKHDADLNLMSKTGVHIENERTKLA